jgi:hypothetical protein
MEKSKVLELLHTETVDLEFVKKDGTVRVMTCTLKADKLPAQVDLEEAVQKKAVNPDVMAVFDLINQGWRSFRWDSLISVNGVIFDPVYADVDVEEYFIL